MAITDGTSLTASNFNVPLFLADTLTKMEDALLTVGYINRQVEQSRREWNRGDVINLKRASDFTVSSDVYANMAAVPSATPGHDQMVIDQYRTTGMGMTDIEEAIVGENAWAVHTQRIGYAIAKEIEKSCTALLIDSPHLVPYALSAANEDILIDCNKVFQELGIPEDGPQLRRFVGESNVWKKFLKVASFTQNQGAGAAGINTQTTGELAEKFGLVPYYSNQLPTDAAPSNAPSGGSATAAAPAGASIVGGGAKGATQVTLTYTGLAAPVVFTKGMVIQLATTADGLLAPSAGQAYRQQLYTVKSSGSVSGGNIVVTLGHPLRQAHAGTWRRIVQAASDAAVKLCGAYYRDAMALAMVALPGNRPGVNMWTATNPNSGLSLRARQVYDGISLRAALIFDAWYGVKTLDVDKMVRVPIDLAN